jgi:hypothetical protein
VVGYTRAGVFSGEGANKMKRFLFLICMVASLPALAGKLDEAKAKAHLEAIATGDLEAVMQDYSKDAFLEWVGGPHDGQYRGREAIRAMWKDFFLDRLRPAKLGELITHSNPKGVSIATSVEYSGKRNVKVWHLFVYRDGVLAAEIWQNESGETKP